MIRLTRANGQTFFVNPEHLIEVGYDEDYKQTLVSTMAEGWYVLESPAEVARKVLEWRLAMERYRAYVNAAALDIKPQSNECLGLAANAKAELVRLAGLEEPT